MAARGWEDSQEQWCPGRQGKKPGEENGVAHSVNSCSEVQRQDRDVTIGGGRRRDPGGYAQQGHASAGGGRQVWRKVFSQLPPLLGVVRGL